MKAQQITASVYRYIQLLIEENAMLEEKHKALIERARAEYAPAKMLKEVHVHMADKAEMLERIFQDELKP